MPQPPNMNQMLKQVQQMQAEMMKAQEGLKDEVVEASAGGGMVTVKVTGELENDRLKLAFAPDATFGKKKCEDNRHLLQTALRALTGSAFEVVCECREIDATEAAPVTLSHDELVDRLKEQFGAKEVFDDGETT